MPATEEYWVKRSERTLIENEKKGLEYEKLLKQSYEKTNKRLRQEVQAFYEKYATEQEISLKDARTQLKPKAANDFRKMSKIYLDEVENIISKYGVDHLEDHKKYLKKMSGKAYITKMNELITNIKHEMEILAAEQEIGLTKTLTGAYEDGLYKTLFDINKNAGMGVDFAAPGEQLLKEAVRERWNGENYSDRIWTRKDKLVKELNILIPLEFVRGSGSDKVAQILSDKLGVDFNSAKRLARTEINYVSNKGSMTAYKESGVVEEYRYLATLDNKTSQICQDLDGKHFPLTEAQRGINHPPMHPWCRSTTIPYFEDDDIGALLTDRAARGDDGKTYKVGKDITYPEWASKHATPEYASHVKSNKTVYAHVDVTPTAPIIVEPTPKPLTVDDIPLPAVSEERLETFEDIYSSFSTDDLKEGLEAARETYARRPVDYRKEKILYLEYKIKVKELEDAIAKQKRLEEQEQRRLNPKAKSTKPPKTLSTIVDHQRKWVDELSKDLTNRYGEEYLQEIEKFEKTLDKFVKANDLCMRVPDEMILRKILNDGRFKTQFETNSSRGTINTRMRKEATKQLFGVSTDDLLPEDYEKYGYLGSGDLTKEFNGYNSAEQYGSISIRFKKENVLNRTTLTFDDSLGSASSGRIIAAKLSKPEIAGIHKYHVDETMSDFVDAVKEHGVKDVSSIAMDTSVRYFELQYHGELTIADIDSISVVGGENWSSLSDMMMDELTDLGIKVNKVEDNKVYVYKKKK